MATNLRPVEPGDTITIVVGDEYGVNQPIQVRALKIVGPKETPAAVTYAQVGGSEEGHIPYEVWQRAAAAQLAIAARKGPAGPADPDEYAKLYNALDDIGKLTGMVLRLKQVGMTLSTRVVLQAGQDMQRIRDIIKEVTGKDYPAAQEF